MTLTAAPADAFTAGFPAFEAARDGDEPAWLPPLRRSALARFGERGLPTTRDEDWKYTSLAPLARAPFRLAEARDAVAPAESLRRLGAEAFAGPQVAFVNGRHAPELSGGPRPQGLEVVSLRETLRREPERLEALLTRIAGDNAGIFAQLNTAFLDDGALVWVRAGAVIEEPLLLAFLSTSADGAIVSHPRILVVAERGSHLRWIESYGGVDGQSYLTNAVTEVVLADGASLDRYKLQQESEAAFHVSSLAVRQGRASRFADHSICLGSALARNDIEVALAEEGGDCTLNGLFVARGEQHMDTHTRIDHAAPHCTSRELYKGVLDGRSRGVFHGTIVVRPGAQKTDAHQTNKNLLLSREALVNSTPALEIFADDVKCKHGSTTGQLDPVALFYLRSRGIGEDAARSLLTYAFASDVVGRIQLPGLRTALEEFLHRRLPSAPQEAIS
jgi:Fe-S cluster assembly protein SufD